MGTFCTNRKYHRPYGPQVAYPYASAVCDASALLCCHASRPPRRGHCLPLRKKCRSAFGIACFFVCAVRCAAAPGRSALLHCHASSMRNARLPSDSGWSRPAVRPCARPRSGPSALRIAPQRFCDVTLRLFATRSEGNCSAACCSGLRALCCSPSAQALLPLLTTAQRFCIILTHVPGQMLSNGRQRRKNLVHVPRDATLRPDSGGTRSAAAWHTAGSAA